MNVVGQKRVFEEKRGRRRGRRHARVEARSPLLQFHHFLLPGQFFSTPDLSGAGVRAENYPSNRPACDVLIDINIIQSLSWIRPYYLACRPLGYRGGVHRLYKLAL